MQCIFNIFSILSFCLLETKHRGLQGAYTFQLKACNQRIFVKQVGFIHVKWSDTHLNSDIVVFICICSISFYYFYILFRRRVILAYIYGVFYIFRFFFFYVMFDIAFKDINQSHIGNVKSFALATYDRIQGGVKDIISFHQCHPHIIFKVLSLQED